MAADRPNSNLPGALPAPEPFSAGRHRSRLVAAIRGLLREQAIPVAPQESPQNDPAVLRPVRCARCGARIQPGQLVRAAVDGIAHLACPSRRQIAHDRRMGRLT